MGPLSGFLFAEPSALEGAARLLDFGDTLTEWNQSIGGEQADFLALCMDWRAVGFDLYTAMTMLAPATPTQGLVGAQEPAAK